MMSFLCSLWQVNCTGCRPYSFCFFIHLRLLYMPVEKLLFGTITTGQASLRKVIAEDVKNCFIEGLAT